MKESVIYQKITSNAEQRGEQRTTKRIALNLLRLGIPNEQIAQGTGLSVEEVKQLASEASQP